MSKKTMVVIPARFSFVNVWEPRSVNGGDPKYGMSLIIPKSDQATVQTILKAIAAAKQEGKAKFGGKVPAELKTPLRDGDTERPEDPNYQASYFINANSKAAPQVVDAKLQPILDHNEVYSGCYGKVSVNFYAYNIDGNQGIAAGLGNVQRLRYGKPLDGRSSAEEDFVIEDDDDDFMR